MKKYSFFIHAVVISAALGLAQAANAAAKVMNPGEAYGQLVYLTVDDVKTESAKYKALNPLSIPVFAELPLDMSVVAGAVTLKQQNLVSHIQLKSRARHTPNLDISELEGGLENAMFKAYPDGTWVHMLLGSDQSIKLEPSTEAQAQSFYDKKKSVLVNLTSDLQSSQIYRTEELRSSDLVRVGAKAGNYGELAMVLNTASRNVVRPGFGIPFYYYQEFVDSNPKIKAMIDSILRDPLMSKVAKTSYREAKLKALQELMTSKEAVVSDKLVDELISRFDQLRAKGVPRKLKLRSSTNSEDLPNFNGAGLYTSAPYKPSKDGKEKSPEKKRDALKETLKTVWASVWTLRAWDERSFFKIPHAQVKMGIQVNLAFDAEQADGVVVTRNIANDARFPGAAVYIEGQRGDKHAVANPEPGVKPAKVLVMYDEKNPLDTNAYQVKIVQSSNIADDGETILAQDNPNPVITDAEAKDIAFQSLKARAHFGPLLDPENKNFALDLEFKVDSEDSGARQVYLKQARPYVD